MKFDFNDRGLEMDTINSARRVSELAEKERLIQKNMESISRQHAINEKTKVEAAEVTIEQFEMYKQELNDSRMQNKKTTKIAIASLAVCSVTLIVTIAAFILQIIQ